MRAYLVVYFFLNELFPKQVCLRQTETERSFFCLANLLNLMISFTKGHCDCGAQQKQWFLFDPLHAYAEYIIEYEYLFSVRYLF
jgi:hypothetical protein